MWCHFLHPLHSPLAKDTVPCVRCTSFSWVFLQQLPLKIKGHQRSTNEQWSHLLSPGGRWTSLWEEGRRTQKSLDKELHSAPAVLCCFSAIESFPLNLEAFQSYLFQTWPKVKVRKMNTNEGARLGQEGVEGVFSNHTLTLDTLKLFQGLVQVHLLGPCTHIQYMWHGSTHPPAPTKFYWGKEKHSVAQIYWEGVFKNHSPTCLFINWFFLVVHDTRIHFDIIIEAWNVSFSN